MKKQMPKPVNLERLRIALADGLRKLKSMTGKRKSDQSQKEEVKNGRIRNSEPTLKSLFKSLKAIGKKKTILASAF